MKKIFLLLLLAFLLQTNISLAQELPVDVATSTKATNENTEEAIESEQVEASLSGKIEVIPSIIDGKAKARDILKYSIRIKNNTDRQVGLYPMVNDISATEGKQEFIEPSILDKKTSLARWITFTRGFQTISSGEEITIPLEIKVDLSAIPGKRYAVISFPQGANRYEAEKRADNAPKVTINILVEEEVIERAQIKNFSTSKNIYVKFPVDFSIDIENFGNKKINPQGIIIVFNRRGEEVSSLDINGSSEQIDIGSTKKVVSKWADGRGFGKFKAKLEIEYGSKDKRDLQDTIYFWVLPIPLLVLFFVVTFILILVVTVILFKKTYRPHHTQAGLSTRHAEDEGVINLRKK